MISQGSHGLAQKAHFGGPVANAHPPSAATPAGFDLTPQEHCEKLVAHATVRSMKRLPKRSARLAQW